MTDSARRPERILVVDDRPMTREIIRDMLECEGFDHVEVAADGMQALMLMSVEDFSLVVTDWDMAPMSGPDLLACTRHHPRMKEIPFVLATGKFEAGEVKEARQAGFDLIVVKPFATEALANEVNTGLRSATATPDSQRAGGEEAQAA